MLRLIKYSFLEKIRDFNLMFWPLVFPIILGTLFYFAFGGMLSADDSFQPVSVAVVEEERADIQFLKVLDELEGKYVFAQIVSKEKASDLLENGIVSGIYLVGSETDLIVTSPTINTSILAGVLTQYTQQKALIEKIATTHPENLQAAIERMMEQEDAINTISIDGSKTNSMNEYFYALIAMGSLYGCFLGLFLVVRLQGNLSALGARRSVTPTHKLKLLFAEMCSAFAIHFINVLVLVGYLKLILGINFAHGPQLLLLCLAGSIVGVTMGMFLGSIGKFSEGVKVGLCIGISMTASFLAGLMYGGMKNLVEKTFPIINRINPAALVSDACYALSVYDNPKKFYLNITILLFESFVFLFICYLSVRRDRYDSI